MRIGTPLVVGQQIVVVLTEVLASIGSAGVPGAGVIMLLMVLEAVGLPVTEGAPQAPAYAMILGIDAILDMGCTGLNATGDMPVTRVVAKKRRRGGPGVLGGLIGPGSPRTYGGACIAT